jgi:UDPglucose--hexose-1-phosphate uridylyltransferase
VLWYHDDPRLALADLTVPEVLAVVDTWRERSIVLAEQPGVRHVLIAEHRTAGRAHACVHAAPLVPTAIAREAEVARHHFQRTGKNIGPDVVRREVDGPRVVAENVGFLACVPWFARAPYNVVVLPKRQLSALADLSDDEQRWLAGILSEVAVRLDNLLQAPWPYILEVHQAPTGPDEQAHFPFRVEFRPPGDSTTGGTLMNDSDPDEDADALRAVATDLYRDRPE